MEVKEYERIVERYMSCIFKVALNACKNKIDAEDITQTTFEKLWRTDKKFEDDEHLKKWLIRVTINECNSLFRTSWMKKRVVMDNIEEIAFSTPEKTELYYALEKLTSKEREIIHLYYYEEYCIHEIAEIMKASETAIQTRLYRARNKLKEEMKKEGWK